MASTPFKLISTATAIAIIPPKHLQTDINSLRKIHDKAYRKWEPHINLLYPFVDPSQLWAAVSVLRQYLLDHQIKALSVDLSQVDSFTHRKNATVFLKPNIGSEGEICTLRNELAKALGCADGEGTHDGTFRPHMTIGQAGLTGSQLERLKEKVQEVAGVYWKCGALIVLKRDPTGEMRMVEALSLGIGDTMELTSDVSQTSDGYHDCFSFNPNVGWVQSNLTTLPENPKQFAMTVATYNLMSDTTAPPFQIRLPLIIEAIKSVTAHHSSSLRVLCLQEVDKEMLPLLLADPFIRQSYPYSSHSPSSLLISRLNLVSLSSAPFGFQKIDFDERHKSMLDISLVGFPLRVINVHLSSGLTEEGVRSKIRQMHLVKSCTEKRQGVDSKTAIVIGDFNITTSSSTIQTAVSQQIISHATAELVHTVIDSDQWDDAYLAFNKGILTDKEILEGETGATFDRTSNPLAAMFEAPIDRSPQRYDRVLFRKSDDVVPERVATFGFPNDIGEVGSDHYGLCATLRIGRPESTLPTTVKGPTRNIMVIEDDQDLLPLIEPYLPTETDRSQREKAVALLKHTLSCDGSLQDLILAPLGSYFMDTYFPDSDVDVLAIGSVAPKVFFDYASARLQELATLDGNDFKGAHFVNSLVSIIELTVAGIKFDLQYCQAPKLLEKYHNTNPASELRTLVFDNDLVSNLPPISIRPLNTYRDTAYLFNTNPDIPSYRLAHRFLSLYLKRRGLYSAKFGYLGGIHLSLMLNRVMKLVISIKNSQKTCNPATIVATFFSYYANFDWARDVITDPDSSIEPARSAREALFIHAIHTPTARPNVASSCTRLSAQTLTSEFNLASKHVEKGGWSWCLRHKNDVVTEFLSAFGAYVRISVDLWDVEELGGDRVRDIVGGIESRMTRLLVGLGRLQNIDARVWPARFRVSSPISIEEKDQITEKQFKGFYLVGISAHEDDEDRKKVLTGMIVNTIREFDADVRRGREFQGVEANMWMDMELVPRKKVSEMGLVLDERDWGAGVGAGLMRQPPSFTAARLVSQLTGLYRHS